jgi:hypothetical protein
MNEGAPSLEVGFAITPQYEGLTKLENGMDRATATIVAEAEKIEKATGGMIKLGGATAQVTAFGNAATREMAEASREMKNAERSGESLARQLQRQVEVYGKTASEIRNMRAEQRALAAEQRGLTELASRIRALSTEMNRLEATSGRATPALRNTGSAMAGVGQQGQDMLVQLSMGGNIFNVLAMQGGQLAGQLANVGGRVGTVASVLAGPFGLAAAGALYAIGALTKGLFDNEEAAQAAEKAMKQFQDRQSDIGNFIDDTTGRLTEQNRVLVLNAVLTRKAQIGANSASISAGRDAAFRAATSQRVNVALVGSPGIYSQMVDPDVQRAITASAGNVDKLAASIAKLSATKRPDLGGLALDISAQAGQAILAQRENEKLSAELRVLGGDTTALAKTTKQATKTKKTAETATRAHGAVNTGAAAAIRGAAQAQDELARSLAGIVGRFDPARKAALEYAETLREIDRLDAAGLLSAGDAIGYKLQAASDAAEVAASRERNALKTLIDANTAVADEMAAVRLNASDATRAVANGFGTATERVEELRQTLSLVSGVLSEISPTFGRAGALIQHFGNAAGDKGMQALSDKLDTIFGSRGDGSFARMITDALKGAGTGMAASSIVLGNDGNNAGAAIGGILGETAGEKLGKKLGEGAFGKALEGLASFAGPLGALAGGLLGGVLGGLFRKAPSASAIVTSATGNVQIGGNDSDARRAVGEVSSGLQTAIKHIADALGGGLGAFATSIGRREDYFRVAGVATTAVGDKNPERGTGVTLLYNGQDAEEAMRIALRDAIQDGAVTGIREGAQRLLQAGSDLDYQLQKALTFQGVFDDLKQRLDPTGFALEQFEKKVAQLNDIFKEAGATAAEYAQLEQLLALQRKDALDEAAKRELTTLNDRRALEVRLLEAQGNATGALALARQIELSETDTALRSLLAQVHAAEDAATAGKQAAQAAEEMRQAWGDVSDSLIDEIKRIQGLSAANGGRSFAFLQGEFNAAVASARSGSLDASKSLPGLSQALLEAAATAATSRQELARIQAQTAASLEGVAGLSRARMSDAEILAAASTTQAATTPTNDNRQADATNAIDELRAEIAGMRQEMLTGIAVVAGNTGRVARHLDNVTGPTGGDAIAVAQVA